MLYIMLNALTAMSAFGLGILLGMQLMMKPKVKKYEMAQEDLPYAYRLVAGQILSGEIPEDQVADAATLMQSKGGHMAIVGDAIECYQDLSLGEDNQTLAEWLLVQANVAHEDECLDIVQPMEKFDFFAGVEMEETNA